MPEMITDPEVYFLKGCGRCDRFDTVDCSALRWGEGLAELRRICRAAGLEEVAKWGQPCYMHAGRNIAIFGAFRDNFRLGFMNAGLLRDSEGVLEPAGPNSQTPSILKFSSNDGPARMARTITAYLEELKGHAEAGTVPPKVERQVDLPDELIEALDADAKLAEAFHALTPGRQKSYAINLNGAKKSETRIARIAKFRDKIIAGKGALDR